MSEQSIVFDYEEDAPKPTRRLEPRWWRYVPRLLLHRTRRAREADYRGRVQAWEDAGRKMVVRMAVPRAMVTPGENDGEFTITAFPDFQSELMFGTQKWRGDA